METTETNITYEDFIRYRNEIKEKYGNDTELEIKDGIKTIECLLNEGAEIQEIIECIPTTFLRPAKIATALKKNAAMLNYIANGIEEII